MKTGEVLLPTDSLMAANFLVFLKDQGYSKFSIKLALVSLKWIHSFFPGRATEKLEDKFLDRLIASADRTMDSKKAQKSPVSKEMIAKMVILGTNPLLADIRDSLMAALSYSLLLRNDELRHLSCKHLILNDVGLTVNIVSSKTDVF